ncbi:hypothetical protein F511_16723 [Dorcoceras hygrometricum]|uniref:Dystroglycan-like n=1 Tax=Dorcoceras hygrometricum TaxID=472368 RepID=A0A2Z7BEU3_9LAMI|nr:hypothetical protein F511_16723 [Dorcoceras hygrometricum]
MMNQLVQLQVESHCLLQLKVSCSGGTVASSRGDNLRWRVAVDWCTSRKVYQSQYTTRRAPVSSRSHHVDFDSVFRFDDAGTLTLSHSSEMASSLISRSHHVDFDSVFRFDDAGIVQMFESLVSTGMMEFLGCPAIFHEQALIEFFENGSVRDGMVVSTISGTVVEINESNFAAEFGLPTEGLTDLSEVPKDLLSNTQRLFSASEKEVSTSCLKKEVKMQYRLLSDILAKSLFVKAGSFDAVTRDRFLLMTAITFDVKVNWGNLFFGVLKEMVTPDSRQAKGFAIQICVLLKNIPGLELGDSKAFPAPRILNEKTVHRIVSVNENVGVEEVGDAPRAKTTPINRTVSKKRPASVDADVAPVIKKKRTTKIKPVAAKKLVLEEQISAVPSTEEQIPVAVKKRQPWTATASQIFDLLSAVHSKSLEALRIQQQEHGIIFEQPCTSTAFDYSVDCGAVFAQFFSVAKSTCWVRPMIFVDGSWTPLQGPGFWRSGCRLSLFLNKVEMAAPAVQDIFVPSVLFIEPVQYWGAATLLVNIWAWHRVCSEATQFRMSGRLRPAFLSSDIVIRNLGVERLPDYFLDEFAHASSSGDTVYRSPFPPDYAYAFGPPILSTTAQEEKLYFVQSPASSPAASPLQESSSSSSNGSMHFDSDYLPVRDQAAAHTSVPVDSNVSTAALEDLKSYFSQRIDESTYEIRSKVNTVEFNVRGDLVKQQAWLRQTFQGACDILERQSQQMNDLKKGLMAPVGTIFQDLFDIKKNQRAQEAKLNALDGQVAALRNDQLEFQNRISADLLSLSTQFADIVEFIRGGDAKKGESGSSSRPPPVRVERRPLPTPQSPRDVAGGSSAVRIPNFPCTTGTFAERVEQARKTPLRERASYLCRRSS